MKAPVNFLYLGGDKCGSTWIHHILSRHPQVSLARAKELFFFDRFYGKGMAWYASQFPDPGTTLRQGEICHDYIYSETAINRIAKDLPDDAVFLVCLRDPLARTVSHYRYLLKIGHTSDSFLEALTSRPQIVAHSLYAAHVAHARARLGPERVRILWFDRLGEDPAAFGRSLCDALGIDFLPDLPYHDRILDSAGARSAHLVRHLRAFGWGLRRLGLPALVARAKDSALLRRALYTRAAAGPSLDDIAREPAFVAMCDRFRRDHSALVADLGPAVPDWPSRWPA